MMDTDATGVIDSLKNSQQQNEPTAAKRAGSNSDTVRTAVATFAGAALGAAGEVVAADMPQPHPAEPEVVVVQHTVPEPESVSNDSSEPAPAPVPEPKPDPDVVILGLATQDNGEGGMATIAGVQMGEEVALLVDVDTDGRIDLYVHDDNHDGQLQADELHDISEHNLHTADAISAYVYQERSEGRTPMLTDLETGQQSPVYETPTGFEVEQPEDDLLAQQMYETTQDDIPDYVNDADAGIMDA